MGTPRPRSMMWLALAIALVIAILMFASGCAIPAPTPAPAAKLIVFEANGKPAKTGILVTIDMVFAPGVEPGGTTYPHEWSTVPGFTHQHLAGPGSVVHMSIKVFAHEPGQMVSCAILIDGKVFDATPLVKNYALCIGPPV